MDLSKMLNPEEPSEPQPPQLLQPGQASANGSHSLPGLRALSLLSTLHRESSSLPASQGDASTQSATSVTGAHNESSNLLSTNPDLNASSILSSMHHSARPETALAPHAYNPAAQTSDSTQKPHQGVYETILGQESAVSRRSSDDSAVLRIPAMPLLNSAAPDGVHRQSVHSEWSGSGVGDGQISPTSNVPSLTPGEDRRDEYHGTDMALGSPLDTNTNRFTAVNIITDGHRPNLLLPLAPTGPRPEDCQELLTDEQMRNMDREVPDDGTPGARCSYLLDKGKICNLPDCQGRKVISQIFGRNKASTRALGDELYICWCRKHYQRARYRQGGLSNYGTVQCNLLLGVLERMINSNAVTSFTITLRLREHQRRWNAGEHIPEFIKKRTFPQKKVVARDPNKRAAPEINGLPVPDFMLDFCGENKSFDDVKRMIGLLRDHYTSPPANVGDGPQILIPAWPDIELLPNISPTWNPAPAEDDAEDPDEGSSTGSKRKFGSERDDSPPAKKTKSVSPSPKSPRGGKGNPKAAATRKKSSTPTKSTRSRQGKSSSVSSSRDDADTTAAEILASLSQSPPTHSKAALAA